MELHIYEGTPQELASILARRPQGRFRLIELAEETDSAEATLDAKLRLWQRQDGTPLLPDVPAQALFAQWAEEDAQMTRAEREAEDRLWQDIEQGLAENGGLRMRHFGE